MKYAMFYELADDGLSKIQANLPGHRVVARYTIHQWLEALAP